MITQNYECRNNHLVCEGLEEFAYLIVSKDTPKIYYVKNTGDSIVVRLAKGKFKGIGHGQTEDAAWENARSRLKFVNYVMSAYSN